MSDEIETADSKASWTIKSMNVEARQLAVACAGKRDLTMAQWIEPAIRHQANLEAGDLVTFPGARPAPDAQDRTAPAERVNLSDLATMLSALTAASAQAQIPMSRHVIRRATALVEQRLCDELGSLASPPAVDRPRHRNGTFAPATERLAIEQTAAAA